MTQLRLYTGEDISFTPIYISGRVQSAYIRLIADEGKAVTNGEIITDCIDILESKVNEWREINMPQDEEIEDTEALNILLGGEL